jgi:peptide/nickel transport system substrate-binding protein
MHLRAARDLILIGGLSIGLTLAAPNFATAQSKYHEAPALTAMVEAGDLPPIEERLPKEPLVQEVADQIGTYGGTLRRGFLGPSDHNNYTRVVYDALVRNSPDGTEVIPHIAKGWEPNDDFSQWKVFLRAGMKWSDGAPFTADDAFRTLDNVQSTSNHGAPRHVASEDLIRL